VKGNDRHFLVDRKVLIKGKRAKGWVLVEGVNVRNKTADVRWVDRVFAQGSDRETIRFDDILGIDAPEHASLP
jgi:predicted hydrolase (HD superfamily)